MNIRKLGLAVNIYKKEIREMLSEIIKLVPEDIVLCGLDEISGLITGKRVRIENDFKDCDAIIALGGDGTLLRASRLVEEDEIPILGIKLRSLGFLTEDDPGRAIGEFLRGESLIQDRMRLEVTYGNGKGTLAGYTALNDVVLHGTGVSRVLHLDTRIGGMRLGEYLSDGVIISTPTGSTAYSLAAGGPIVDPVRMEAILITPLCPHSLSVRPVVVSSSETIVIKVVEDGQETMLTIDGQEACRVSTGERITVRKSGKVTRLVTNSDYNFYDLVRKKLKWGGVLRRH